MFIDFHYSFPSSHWSIQNQYFLEHWYFSILNTMINHSMEFSSHKALFSSSITTFYNVSFIDSTLRFASSLINENCPFQAFYGVQFSQSPFFLINNSIPLCEFHWFYVLICIINENCPFQSFCGVQISQRSFSLINNYIL